MRASTYRSSPDELRSRLHGLIRELNAEASRGAVVLVEGPRDEAALRAAGSSGPLREG
ncbi:MAG: hypothetical protein JHC24_01915, partial [Thaumarchaeota archaeon]|nr:hypothetical protein [Nitrososphaerota archaeon]